MASQATAHFLEYGGLATRAAVVNKNLVSFRGLPDLT